MHLGFSFFFTSIMLGAGLAMDAFSVSRANGLNGTEHEAAQNVRCGRNICIAPVCHADDWLDLCFYGCKAVWRIREVYPVDCACLTWVHWWEDAL